MVTVDNVNSGGYWAVSVSGVTANGQVVKEVKERTAILDTGTVSDIFMLISSVYRTKCCLVDSHRRSSRGTQSCPSNNIT